MLLTAMGAMIGLALLLVIPWAVMVYRDAKRLYQINGEE